MSFVRYYPVVRGAATVQATATTPPPSRKQKSKEVECQTEPVGEDIEVQTTPSDTRTRASQTPVLEYETVESQTTEKELADVGTATEHNLEEKAAQVRIFAKVCVARRDH
jgi:hypothetical protein